MTNSSWINGVDYVGRRNAYETFSKSYIPKEQTNLQNVFTPYKLCENIIDKLKEHAKELKGKTFLCLNMEFVEVLIYNEIKTENIWFLTDCPHKVQWAKKKCYDGLNVLLANDMLGFLDQLGETKVKFDIVVGNPPYQDASENIGNILWDKFVKGSMEIVNENGYLCMVHPSKWRNPESKLWELMSQNQIHYLEIHNISDGLRTFNAATRYDWYVMQKTARTQPFTVKDEDGELHQIDLSEWSFLPNGMYNFIGKIIARGEEKRCEVLFSYSDYEARKPWMSKTKTEVFVYPCVRYISAKDGKIDCWYSSNKDHGHFGVKKVIFGIGSNCGSFYKDVTGEYGMAQYAAGVVSDNEEELELIFKAMNTKKFMKVMTYCMTTTQKVNYRILQCFRHDFWREFVNEDGTEKV